MVSREATLDRLSKVVCTSVSLVLIVGGYAFWSVNRQFDQAYRPVVVRTTTLGGNDLEAFEAIRHKQEQPERFTNLLKAGRIVEVPVNTEGAVVGPNWMDDKPIQVQILNGPKSGTIVWLRSYEVQHQHAIL